MPDPRLVTRGFVLLVCAHFLQALGYSSMILLPLYLVHLGASRTQIGGVMAAAAVGGLALRPAAGWALDTLGRRPTIAAGTVVMVLGMGLIGAVDEVGPLAYTARVLFGVGAGTLFTGYFAFAADIIPPSRRTEGLALFGISGLLPLAFNPLIGDLGLAPSELRLFFPAVGAVVMLSLPCVFFLREPTAALRARQGGEPFRLSQVIEALRAPAMRPVWLATVVFGGLVAVFMTFATVVADHRGVERPTLMWLSYSLGAIGVRLFGARLPDRLGPHNLLAPALGTYGVAFLLAAESWSTGGFLVAGLLAGLGHGYCFPVLSGQVVTRSPTRVRGSALAMFTALWEVATLALTPLFGLIADHSDDATMLSAATLCAVVGLAAWSRLEHRHGPN